MPDPVTAIIGGGSVLSAVIGASSAKKAGKQQADAAGAQLDLQRDIFETVSANQAPFIEGGTLALDALLFELGLGDAPTFGGDTRFRVGDSEFDTRGEAEEFQKSFRGDGEQQQFFVGVPDEREGGFKFVPAPEGAFGAGVGPSGTAPDIEEFTTGGTTFGGFQESPGFKFGMQQGISAVDASAAASGSLFSGSTLQALTEFGQGFASLGRGTFLDRLSSLVSGGQGAVGQLSQSAATFGQGASSALAGLGNARSAGTIGVGNALQGGLNSLATTLGGINFGGGGGVAPAFSPIPIARPSLAF